MTQGLVRRSAWALRFPLFAAVGYAAATAFSVGGLADSRAYLIGISALLAVGLYGATCTIPRAAFADWRTITAVVTVGVVLKAAIVGGVLALAFQDPAFLVLGVVVAQIDPLSVASLLRESPMSPRAKALLASWACFDDPVTVILCVAVMTAAGSSFSGASGGTALNGPGGLEALLASVALNAALAGAAWLLLRLSRRLGRGARDPAAIAVLAGTAAVAVWRFLLLGLAATGLFLRPRTARCRRLVERAVALAFPLAVAMLGVLLHHEIRIYEGIALGTVAFFSQIVPGFLFTRNFAWPDRVYLAFSQQNGMTSVVLALALVPSVPRAAAVVGPAIVTINILHSGCNHVLKAHPTLFGLSRRAIDPVLVAGLIPVVPGQPQPVGAGRVPAIRGADPRYPDDVRPPAKLPS